MGREDRAEGIELKAFIRDALIEIAEGVYEAREKVAGKDATVGSDPVYGHVQTEMGVHDGKGRTVSKVEFDIALTKTDAANARSGIGVFLGSVGLGSQAGTRDEATSLSRIKFSVPIVFPGKRRDSPS